MSEVDSSLVRLRSYTRVQGSAAPSAKCQGSRGLTCMALMPHTCSMTVGPPLWDRDGVEWKIPCVIEMALGLPCAPPVDIVQL
jgi:hypothetical protein